MHCVTWTYTVPPQLTKPVIEKLFADVAKRYLGVPGLIRKYFGFSEDGKSVVGIYLWKTKADADRFYSPQWIADVTKRWGATPAKAEWIVPVVAESTTAQIVRG